MLLCFDNSSALLRFNSSSSLQLEKEREKNTRSMPVCPFLTLLTHFLPLFEERSSFPSTTVSIQNNIHTNPGTFFIPVIDSAPEFTILSLSLSSIVHIQCVRLPYPNILFCTLPLSFFSLLCPIQRVEYVMTNCL